MAVLSFDELIAKIKTKIGEDTSDESIELLEDVTDTFNANNDEDWKTKYEENDKEWRKKYIDRFSGSGGNDPEEEEEEEEEKTTFEDLFKEED